MMLANLKILENAKAKNLLLTFCETNYELLCGCFYWRLLLYNALNYFNKFNHLCTVCHLSGKIMVVSVLK